MWGGSQVAVSEAKMRQVEGGIVEGEKEDGRGNGVDSEAWNEIKERIEEIKARDMEIKMKIVADLIKIKTVPLKMEDIEPWSSENKCKSDPDG